MHASTDRQSSQSSVRLLQILECLAANRVPMRLQDLAKQVNMTHSTVLRYLYALESTDYIYHDEDTSRYGLTWKVCKLSENLNTPLGLRNIVNPYINWLANTLSLGACLVTEHDGECLYLDCIDAPDSPVLQRIGKWAPLHATGSGKILLAQYTNAQLEEYISQKGLQQYTEHTITDPDKLRKELELIRYQGFSCDNEECEIGLRCISCPIRNFTGHIVGAVSIFGGLSKMNQDQIMSKIYPVLKDTTTAISARLGYTNG